ncbi:DUF4230 domain-containing protein [Rubinisphaera sp. ICM_H10]|nr:DUF4230 domain-containing protein [Rubinisphaera margarita]
MITIAGATLAAARSRVPEPRPKPPPVVVKSTGPSIDRVRELGDLTSLKLQVSVLHTSHRDAWFWGGHKGAWMIKGDALYATDLRLAQLTQVEGQGEEKRVRIELSPPTVRWSRVDHEGSLTYELKSDGLIAFGGPDPSVHDAAMKQAQQLVRQSAETPEYQQQARENAERVIVGFCAALGYRADVVWTEIPEKPLPLRRS